MAYEPIYIEITDNQVVDIMDDVGLDRSSFQSDDSYWMAVKAIKIAYDKGFAHGHDAPNYP